MQLLADADGQAHDQVYVVKFLFFTSYFLVLTSLFSMLGHDPVMEKADANMKQ